MDNRNTPNTRPPRTAEEGPPRTDRPEPRVAQSDANEGAQWLGPVARAADDQLFADFERSQITTKARQLLLLPRTVVDALEREREAQRERADTDQDDPPAPASAEAPPVVPSPTADADLGHDWHLVFDPEAIRHVADETQHGDRERRPQFKRWVEKMARNGGKRLVRDLPEQLDELLEQFPNFREAAQVIEAIGAVHRHVPTQRQSEALLLVGPPGVGKTFFIEAFANLAHVDLGPVSLGSAQGAFELTGTSQHWSNPTPGKVWQLLAEGDYANAILLLDEIDKAGGDERYRTSSALLDLLESRTAGRFVDQALNIEIDASMLWKIATANTIDAIAPPVLSRLHVIAIEAPSDNQLRLIYLAQWRELVADLSRPPELSRSVIRQLIASREPPRVTQRLLRIGLGRALHDRRRRVSDLPSNQKEPRSQPIGFVRPMSSP